MSTIAASVRRSTEMVAIAGQTDFPVDFPPLSDGGVYVGVFATRTRAGATLTLTVGADFDVVAPAGPSFTARLHTAALIGDTYVFYSQVPTSRSREHLAGSGFRYEVAEADAAQLFFGLQEHRRRIDDLEAGGVVGGGGGGGDSPVASVNGLVGAVVLTAALLGAAAVSHAHAVADVTGLQAALDGKQATHAKLTALAGLTGGANKLPYFDGADSLAQASISTFTLGILNSASAAAWRTAIGAGTGGGGTGGDMLAANNLSDVASVSTARTNLGLGALAVKAAVNNADWSGTALAVANGGTGSTTASAARAALGLGLLAVKDTVNNADWSGTTLSVANGGTAATTAATARANLGVTIGSNVQAWSARLDTLAAATTASALGALLQGATFTMTAKKDYVFGSLPGGPSTWADLAFFGIAAEGNAGGSGTGNEYGARISWRTKSSTPTAFAKQKVALYVHAYQDAPTHATFGDSSSAGFTDTTAALFQCVNVGVGGGFTGSYQTMRMGGITVEAGMAAGGQGTIVGIESNVGGGTNSTTYTSSPWGNSADDPDLLSKHSMVNYLAGGPNGGINNIAYAMNYNPSGTNNGWYSGLSTHLTRTAAARFAHPFSGCTGILFSEDTNWGDAMRLPQISALTRWTGSATLKNVINWNGFGVFIGHAGDTVSVMTSVGSRTLEVGAADSDGTGYRRVRCLN